MGTHRDYPCAIGEARAIEIANQIRSMSRPACTQPVRRAIALMKCRYGIAFSSNKAWMHALFTTHGK